MKKSIRVFCAVLASIMTMATVAFADNTNSVVSGKDVKTSPFSDVDITSKEGIAIDQMHNLGYLAGYEDGTFNPKGQITRAELVRVINRVMTYNNEDEIVVKGANNIKDFSDNRIGEWQYDDVRIAQSHGYINGFEDNSFRAKDKFTRQQVCVVLSLIAELDDTDAKIEISDLVSPWASRYVNNALANGIFELETGNTFRATQNITRGEVCIALLPFVTEKEVIVSEVVTDKSGEAVTNDEGQTMTTTTKTIVSTGGGGSGKISVTTTNSESKTESTTQATNESKTESTTGVTNESKTETTTLTDKTISTTKSPAITTTKKTEATTETTTQAPNEKVTIPADMLKSLNRIIKIMNQDVTPNCKTSAEVAVANAITGAMSKYVADPTYDFTEEADEAMAMYRALGAADKTHFMNLLSSNLPISDVLKVQEKFFPGLL